MGIGQSENAASQHSLFTQPKSREEEESIISIIIQKRSLSRYTSKVRSYE